MKLVRLVVKLFFMAVLAMVGTRLLQGLTMAPFTLASTAFSDE